MKAPGFDPFKLHARGNAVQTFCFYKMFSTCFNSFRARHYGAGVVSGLRRSIPSKNGTTIRNCIQTDAEIPETAAGGALLDSSGRLIGLAVTTFGRVSAGLSFAIPVDDLVNIVPSLITLHQIS